MNKLKTFYYIFKRSLTDFSYYKEVLKAPIWFSLKYLALLIFASFFIQAVIVAVQAATQLPKLPDTVALIETRLENLYPKDFVVQVEDGAISTNKENPYFIDIPEIKNLEGYDHLITINTEASVDEYAEYKTIFFVTETAVVYPERVTDNVTEYKVTTTKDFEDESITITRSDYNNLVSNIQPFLNWANVLVPVLLLLATFMFPLIAASVTLLWNIVFIALLSVLVWIVSKLFSNGLSYVEVYQLGLHGVTISIVLTFLFQLTGIRVPLVFVSSFLFFMVLLLGKWKKLKA